MSEKPKVSAGVWSKSFTILLLSNMALNMGMQMSNSLLSIFADHLGAGAALIGFIISSFAISSILFRFIAAPVMDTYNRKYLIIIAAFAMSAAFWGYSISTNVTMLICFRLLQGCAMVFGNACCLAMVADILPKEKYNAGLGYFSLIMLVCMAVAPSIGIELVKLTGFRVIYTLAACLMLLAGILACFFKSDFKRTKKFKMSLSNIIAREALIPASLQLLVIFAISCTTAFLYLFAADRNVTGNIGLYFTVSAATMLLTRPVIGRLTDRFGMVKVSVPAMILGVGSFFIISISNSLASFLVASIISAVGQGAYSPAIQALTMKAVTTDRRGVAGSTNFIAQDVGAMIGSIIAGQLVQLSGYVVMWRVMAVAYAIAVFILIFFRRRITRIEEEFAA